VYSDRAASFTKDLGKHATKRASHVEPGDDGNWYVDLSPSGGPVLGPFAFDNKEAALAAELEWLNQHVI
jgi:hypothetical protein